MQKQSELLMFRASRRIRYRKWYYTVFLTLAAIVVFCTVYALILPAITLSQAEKNLDCKLQLHAHKAECYNEAEELICGKADYVIHTHDDKCYDKTRELVCTLPEIAAHTHTDKCYEDKLVLVCDNIAEDHIHDSSCYETQKKLACKEVHVLHKHEGGCYDENGALICGMLQLEEHVHSDGCFTVKKNTDSTEEGGTTPAQNVAMLAADDGISPLAERPDQESGYNWGYNDDGSMWWAPTTSLQQVTEISENTAYLIMGCNGNNLMTEGTFTKDGLSYLAATRLETCGDPMDYQHWYFEKAEGDSNYYVYHLSEGSVKKYLKFPAGEALDTHQSSTVQTALTENKADAQVFSVTKSGDTSYSDHFVLGADVGGKTFYVNSFYDDNAYESTHWLGYEGISTGDYLKICRYERSSQIAHPITTTNSANTVINLFDYWASENASDIDSAVDAPLESSINQNHALKFTLGSQTPDAAINKWTGARQNPLQGIVANKLDENGYPTLSGEHIAGDYDRNESLEYLFNPEYEHPGKASYRNVTDLLRVDEEGYYTYDSKQHIAEYDKKTNSFNVYDRPSEIGQFFPFNKAPQIMTAHRTDAVINHYFGMTLTTRFIQKHGGYTDDRKVTPTSFNFSGDDDVWVFIDGVLVGDVGGIHDASSLSINFATGEVEVKVLTGNEPLKTTLRECYQKAGKESVTTWSDINPNIYANETVHTLKFFFMERGNYDSNMALQYNLTHIPETAVYKINQYGEAIPGVKFSVYPTNANYDILEYTGGPVATIPENYKHDAQGNITDADGNIIVKSLYSGITDSEGEMLFVDSDEMPYSINELHDMFGKYFILREYEVPEGYRIITEDNYLEIWEGAKQKILKSADVLVTGTKSNQSLQITATDTLHLKSPYNGQSTVQYCDAEGKIHGTLFAVVYKYVGEIDASGNITEMNSDDAWAPVYGSDKEGYHLLKKPGDAWNGQAIEAAIKGRQYGETEFKMSSGGALQLTLDNLPGSITTYYTMLPAESKLETRYSVSYFWSPASSLEEADPNEIYRVYTFENEVPNYSGFERVFGAKILIPNLNNRLAVQKMDGDKLINGATFAMYRVQQQDDGTLLFRQSDGSFVARPDDYKISADGVITGANNYTVTPYDKQVTRTLNDGIHTGTAYFDAIPTGQYIIREVDAPDGYKINPTDIMVEIRADTIYCNAGTADDGVTIGRGPGHLIDSLNQFASHGEIDNTLTWIFTRLLVTGASDRFSDIGDSSKVIGWIKKNNSAEVTTNEDEAFETYLEYSAGNVGTAFDYVPDPERNPDHTSDGDGYRRIFTKIGWSYYSMFQDYEYGKVEAAKTGAAYEDFSGKNLMHLFSRSNYIRVDNERVSSLEVSKTVQNPNGDPNETFDFTVSLTDDNGAALTGEYPYQIFDIAEDGTRTAVVGSEGIIRNGSGVIALKNKQVAVIDKLPYTNAKYTVTETRKSKYNTTAVRDAGTADEKTYRFSGAAPPSVDGTVQWDNVTGDYVSTVDFTNIVYSDITLIKADAATPTIKLAGAEFILAKETEANMIYYYTPDGSWVEDPKAAAKFVTDSEGKIVFEAMADGDYALTETAAPDGYRKLYDPVKITVRDGVIFSAHSDSVQYDISDDKLSFTVTNNTSYGLPATGGSGTILYTAGGILLIAISLVYGYLRRRKCERRYE